MQQLTYENLLGERVDFFHDPYIFAKVTGIGPTDPDIATVSGAYQPGATVRGLLRTSRKVDITLHIHGATRAQMYQLRQKLAGVMTAGKAYSEEAGCAKLYYQNDNGRWWTYAVPESGPDEGSRYANWLGALTVSFSCESAYWFSIAREEASFLYSGGGFSLPFSFPVSFGSREYSLTVNNTGQVDAPVEVTISGAGETPSLYNATTGKRLRLTSALPSGSILHINTDPARLEARITNEEGETNAFGLLDVSAPLSGFVLRPGQNQLIYEPGGASAQSNITVSWYNRFEGV